MAAKMKFDIFDCIRDRQITKKNSKENGLVLLIGDRPHNIQTLLIFLDRGLKIDGVVIASTSSKKYKLSKLLAIIKSDSILRLTSILLQIFIDHLLFGLKNRLWYSKNHSFVDISKLKNKYKFDLLKSENYLTDEVYNFISSKQPRFIAVHTQAWVPKRIREISSLKIIIGGHPGDTNYYRGSHSPFWAIRNNEYYRIGYTVFHLDGGVDTGKILNIGKPFSLISSADTYQIISWKLMREIAYMQTEIIKKISKGKEYNGESIKQKDLSRIYGLPDLYNYFIYLFFWISVRIKSYFGRT